MMHSYVMFCSCRDSFSFYVNDYSMCKMHNFKLRMFCTILGRETPKLRDILNDIVPKWTPKWKQFGIQLGIDIHLLDTIEKDHSGDSEMCCITMFSKWLDKNPAASWKDIFTAVDNLLLNGMIICSYLIRMCLLHNC